MKKLFGFLTILLMIFFVSSDVMADEALPIKKINFCGIENLTFEPSGTMRYVNVKQGSNRCKITVELIDDSYSLVDFVDTIEFVQEGYNDQIINVKASDGAITKYTFRINYVKTGEDNSSTSEENPSTGDNQIVYLVVALVSASVIGISYNNIIKYSKTN